MYQRHMPKLRDAGLSSYEAFCDIVMFVLLSVRVQFVRVPQNMKEFRKAGAKCPHLWGWKKNGYDALQSDVGRETWYKVRVAKTAEEAIELLTANIPGLQIVKAGFVAQMLGFECGCIDGRNVKHYGVNVRQFKWDKRDYSVACLKRRVAHYVDTCSELGGAETLWNKWCEGLAKDNFMTPSTVSAMHLAALR